MRWVLKIFLLLLITSLIIQRYYEECFIERDAVYKTSSSNKASEKNILIKSVAQVANRYFYIEENVIFSLKFFQETRKNGREANGSSVFDPISFLSVFTAR